MNKRNKFSNFLLNKAMYAALAVCLVGAGTAAWITINSRVPDEENDPFVQNPQTLEKPQENINHSLSNEEILSPPEEAAAVEQKQQDISKELPTPTENLSDFSNSGSSSTESKESAIESELPKLSEKSQTSSFILPLNTQIIEPFSGDVLVKNETLKEWRTHNGVDFKAQSGDIVKAACDGKVTAISFDPLWGTSVEISANGYVLNYCGLGEDLAIKLNDYLDIGENIGTVGTIPCESADGLHLHFSVKFNDEYIDPLSLIPEENSAE